MTPTERILNLIASLLDATEPVPTETIRGWFPEDYLAVSQEAFERKFERDKAELAELGIPLRYVHGEDGLGDGYVIAREEAYLPDLELDANELTTLRLAGSAVLSQPEFPYHRDLARGLEKMELCVQARPTTRRRLPHVLLNHPARPDDPRLGDLLEKATRALEARHRLWLVYHGLYSGEVTERAVDPYGLLCWRGRWALVGYCHQRASVRRFSLHRIREVRAFSETKSGPDFDIPEEFSLTEWQRTPPWNFHAHDPVAVVFEVETDRAWLAERQLGVASEAERDGWSRFSLQVTYVEGFVEWALRQGPALRIVGPAQVRKRAATALEGVLARHGAGQP